MLPIYKPVAKSIFVIDGQLLSLLLNKNNNKLNIHQNNSNQNKRM